MQDPIYFIGGGIAGWLLLMIAFPEQLMPQPKDKRTRVGPTFWGIYPGADPNEDESMVRIELTKPARKEKVIGGSAMYSTGRGTSFRQ